MFVHSLQQAAYVMRCTTLKEEKGWVKVAQVQVFGIYKAVYVVYAEQFESMLFTGR